MSIACMKRVWDNSKHKGSDLLVLLVIADHANDDGSGAWPSILRLATMTRLSERAVQYSLRHLEASGELIIQKNAGPKGCNSFTVTLGCKNCAPSDSIPSGAKISPAKIAPVQSATQGGAICDIKGVQPTAPEPSLDPSRNHHILAMESVIAESGIPGYKPGKTFYKRIDASYIHLDLPGEATLAVEWLREHGKRKCTSLFLLKWLGNAAAGYAARGSPNGRASPPEPFTGLRCKPILLPQEVIHAP